MWLLMILALSFVGNSVYGQDDLKTSSTLEWKRKIQVNDGGLRINIPEKRISKRKNGIIEELIRNSNINEQDAIVVKKELKKYSKKEIANIKVIESRSDGIYKRVRLHNIPIIGKDGDVLKRVNLSEYRRMIIFEDSILGKINLGE